jgi:hypothetical protein
MSRDCAIRDKELGIALESEGSGEAGAKRAGASDDFSNSPLADAEFSGEGLLAAGAVDRVEEDDSDFRLREVATGIHFSLQLPLQESWHTYCIKRKPKVNRIHAVRW